MKRLKDLIRDMDKPLLWVTVLLFIFGLLNIVTASSKAVVLRYNTPLYNYFFKQLAPLLVGIVVTVIVIQIPTRKYRFWGALGFFAISGALAYLSLYGTFHKGSKNWIAIPGFGTFQPSEFAKPVMIVCLALLFELFYKKLRTKGVNHYDMIAVILFVGCVFPAIVFFQKDLGTMIILFTIFASMFFVSPILKVEKLKTIGIGALLVFCAACIIIGKTGSLLTASQLSRFDFFDPCADYENGGYQICNGFIAINDGSLLGVGIGNSKQVSYIPESHTDSVFAIVAEEYGFLFSTVIFFAYLFVLKRITSLATKANTLRGKYICFGVAIYIFLHILVNLGGLFGVMPLTGVPLPFLSYGGSFTLSLILALAMVQRVHIETKNQKIKIASSY